MFSENATSTAYGMPSLLLIYMKVNNATSINFGTCHLASLSNTDATTGRLDICRAYATMIPDWHLNIQKIAPMEQIHAGKMRLRVTDLI